MVQEILYNYEQGDTAFLKISAVAKGWSLWHLENGTICYRNLHTSVYNSDPSYLDLYRDI